MPMPFVDVLHAKYFAIFFCCWTQRPTRGTGLVRLPASRTLYRFIAGRLIKVNGKTRTPECRGSQGGHGQVVESRGPQLPAFHKHSINSGWHLQMGPLAVWLNASGAGHAR